MGGSSKRCLTGPLQYKLRTASGGRGSERLPCSPRNREGRGRTRVLLRQGGAQAGSVPCRTISPNTPLLLNTDKCQVSECSWSKSEMILSTFQWRPRELPPFLTPLLLPSLLFSLLSTKDTKSSFFFFFFGCVCLNCCLQNLVP